MYSKTKIPFCCATVSFSILFFLYQSVLAGETLTQLERELQALIDSSKQSVVTVTSVFSHEVSVETETGILSFFKSETEKRPYTYSNIGTGVVFDHKGHIITRSSVVFGSDSNFITFCDGRRLRAEFVGQDVESGFAVLKVDAKDLRPGKFTKMDSIMPGTLNLIIGNSLGVYPSTIFGAVNGIRNDGMLQLSADLTPGNNGSPVINLRGEIVGLLAGQLDAASEYEHVISSHITTVAYPTGWIRKIVDDIINVGHVRKGWLGVVGYYDGRRPKIREIKENSPAEKAGLIEGDVIIQFSDREIHNISELALLVEYTRPGTQVPLKYMRGSNTIQTNIEIGEKKMPDFTSEFETSGSRVQNEYYDELPAYDESKMRGQNLSLERRVLQLETEMKKLKKLMIEEAQ